jgi:triosephosphate isomerase
VKIVVANWKMHHTASSARDYLATSREALRLAQNVEVVICPPFPLLSVVREEALGTPIKLGAQNLSSEDEGAYTGEVSALQLTDLVSYVIVGHSERKKYFGETPEIAWAKARQAMKHGLKPILCFEKLQDLTVVTNSSGLILAYEPTFAIGTGHPDTPENAAATAKAAKHQVGGDAPVLYGGSVTAENAREFLDKEQIAGFLVGKASLDPTSFVSIVHAAS